jgi:CTP:molybdopterin cytidylyltransferase MocA
MPAVSAEHLRELMTADEVTASSYAGRRGVPAYFPRSMFERLIELRGDAGAREMLKDAPAVQLAGGEMDVDTAEDLAKARERFG